MSSSWPVKVMAGWIARRARPGRQRLENRDAVRAGGVHDDGAGAHDVRVGEPATSPASSASGTASRSSSLRWAICSIGSTWASGSRVRARCIEASETAEQAEDHMADALERDTECGTHSSRRDDSYGQSCGRWVNTRESRISVDASEVTVVLSICVPVPQVRVPDVHESRMRGCAARRHRPRRDLRLPASSGRIGTDVGRWIPIPGSP